MNKSLLTRIILAMLIGGSVVAYTIGILSGEISEKYRISGVHLAIIILGGVTVLLLLQPEALDRLKHVEVSGFKLEMLENVREKQAKQAKLLDDIELILPLLLPETERKHLLNLDRGKTQDYHGNSAFRAEIRRLRSIKLIEMLPGKSVSETKSDKTFNLAEYVRLTILGESWVRRIRQIEKNEGNGE